MGEHSNLYVLMTVLCVLAFYFDIYMYLSMFLGACVPMLASIRAFNQSFIPMLLVHFVY